MTTLLVIVHVIVSVFLIFVVLIQGGKGAEMGAAFGGSTQTLFGSRGAATFLSKLTTIVAIVFMLTSLTMAVLSAKTESVIPDKGAKQTRPLSNAPAGPLQQEKAPEPPAQTKPAQPAK
ncbi:MAG: preprotein translocase subunit SecG [Nitrospirae bacterium]|nr:preprotein translocase subunit SecG [Nitrospirota bacterium]